MMTWRAMGLTVLLSLSTVLLGLLAYHHFLATPPVGVVDAGALWKAGQAATAQSLMAPDANDEQRRVALVAAQHYGEKLQAAMDRAAADCRCVLLTSNAVLAANASSNASRVPDYTAQVARLLGVSLGAPQTGERP